LARSKGRGRNLASSVSGENLGRGRKKLSVAWLVGSTRQWGKRETGTDSGEKVSGPRARFSAGPKRCPWPFFIFCSFFLLFLFCFLISFIAFVFDIQMTSNQFVNFSKIQLNIPEQ
jgi:hypothetical protein